MRVQQVRPGQRPGGEQRASRAGKLTLVGGVAVDRDDHRLAGLAGPLASGVELGDGGGQPAIRTRLHEQACGGSTRLDGGGEPLVRWHVAAACGLG